MNEAILERILARGEHGLQPDEIDALRRIVTYFDRSSLRIVWDDGAAGKSLYLHLSDDAVRYVLSVGELISLWHALRAGQPIVWQNLPTTPGRSPHPLRDALRRPNDP